MPVLDFSREHDDHAIELIDKEIDTWMDKFTDGIVMRCHYETENDLELDWKKYMSQPYKQKCIANNIAYRLYGMKNEEVYHKFKKWFLTHDVIQNTSYATKTYAPSDKPMIESAESDFLDQQARETTNATGYYIITNDSNTAEDLEYQLYKFRSMSDEKKRKADDYSIQIYGKKNEERYNDMIGELLARDVISDYDDIMGASDIEYRPYMKEVVMKEGFHPNNPYSIISIYECAREQIKNPTTSIQEAIMIADNVLSVSPDTVVESMIRGYLLEELDKKVSDNEDLDYLGYMTPYFLPQEMQNIGVFSMDKNKYFNNNLAKPTEWFANYQARCIGLKPDKPVSGMDWYNKVSDLMEKELTPEIKQEVLELGWNPNVPISKENLVLSGKRTNQIIKDNMGYNFIDISEMTNNTILEKGYDIDADPNRGIFVIFTHADDKPEVPRVLLSLDYTLKNMYPMNNGLFTASPISITDLGDTDISVYLLRLNDKMMQKVNDMYNYFKKYGFDYRFKYSFIHAICTAIKKVNPTIANEQLFCTYLINMVLAVASSTYQNPANIMIAPTIANMRDNPSDKDSVYIIYRGSSLKYNETQVTNLIDNDSYIELNDEIESYRNYVQVDPIKSNAIAKFDHNDIL